MDKLYCFQKKHKKNYFQLLKKKKKKSNYSQKLTWKTVLWLKALVNCILQIFSFFNTYEIVEKYEYGGNGQVWGFDEGWIVPAR